MACDDGDEIVMKNTTNAGFLELVKARTVYQLSSQGLFSGEGGSSAFIG